jgi:hypothetical protein
LVILVSGFFAAFYHSRPHEDYHYANRQTFVDLQLATFEERKLSADTLYETKQLSRKEIQKRLSNFNPGMADPDEKSFGTSLTKKSFLAMKEPPKENPKPQEKEEKKGVETPMKKKKWDSIDIDD